MGNRLGHLHRAFKKLNEICGTGVRTSFLYETDPVGLKAQRKFLNAACAFETGLSPRDLLVKLKELEREAGRGTVVPYVPNGPRPLDMDILMYDDLVLSDESDPDMPLIVPHPRMHERKFVLQPVADVVDSNHLHPILGKSIHDLLHNLPSDEGVKRVFPACPDVMWSFERSTPKLFGVLNVTPDSFSDGGAVMRGENVDTNLTLARVEQMLEEGDFEAAMETFSAILQEDTNNVKSYVGLMKSHIELGDLDQAEAILNGMPLEISQKPEVEPVHAQIELAKQALDAGPISDLAKLVEKNPDDHEARFKLAQALHGSGQVEDAVDQLLELFKRDKEWNDEAAKSQLFVIFEALEPNNPIVLNGRRKLSSLIFA